MNEHDLRQLRLIRDLLQGYEAGKVTLSSLLAGLEALLDALESANEEWMEAFRRQWSILEIDYAVSLDRNQPTLSRDGLARISNAIENMRGLLSEHLSEDNDLSESV